VPAKAYEAMLDRLEDLALNTSSSQFEVGLKSGGM